MAALLIWIATMVKKTKALVTAADADAEAVFEKAAEVFRVMSAPMRLRIISALCDDQRPVRRREERG